MKKYTLWLILLALVLWWLLSRRRPEAQTDVNVQLQFPDPRQFTDDDIVRPIAGAVPWSPFALTNESYGSDALNAAFFGNDDAGGIAPSFIQQLRM